MAKPDDVPKWALEDARRSFFNLNATSAELLPSDIEHDVQVIARALLSAKREGMEKAAEISDQVGEAYGMDETGWWECTETVSASIRQAAKEMEQ